MIAFVDFIKHIRFYEGSSTLLAERFYATSAFTMDVYCHVSKSMNRESAARTQAFYESVKPV